MLDKKFTGLDSDVNRLPVGSSAVLFGRATSFLHMLDAVSRFTWDALSVDRDITWINEQLAMRFSLPLAQVRRQTQRTLDEWHQAGLLDDPESRAFNIGQKTIRISGSASKLLGNTLDHLATGSSRSDHHVSVGQREGFFDLRLDGRPVTGLHYHDALVRPMIDTLFKLTDCSGLQFEAAGFEHPIGTLLLFGNPAVRLAAAISFNQQMLGCLDHCLLNWDPGTRQLSGAGRPLLISMQATSRQQASDHGGSTVFVEDERPMQFVSLHEWLPVANVDRLIVVLARDDGPRTPEPISSHALLLHLLEQQPRLGLTRAGQDFCSLLATAECLEISSRNPTTGVEKAMALL